MGWHFEHWDNGVCYFHHQRWEEFRSNLEKSYRHNKNHRRALVTLINPCDRLVDAIGVTHNPLTGMNYYPSCDIIEDDFSTIFEPFPRWFKAPNIEESYIMFVEDGHKRPRLGEDVIFYSVPGYYLSNSNKNLYCFFKDKYWKVVEFEGGHHGPYLPPPPPPKWRSIDD